MLGWLVINARRAVAAAAAHPFAVLAVLYAGVRCSLLFEVEPRSFPDTGTYDHVASAPLLSRDFVAGWRAPSLPLLYKLVPGPDPRVLAQALVSIASWLWLATAAAQALHAQASRVAGFACVLGFSLSGEILQWDSLLLSESLSISLTAAVAGASLRLAHRPTRSRAIVLGVLLVPWVFARDAHTYLLVLVALALAASLAIGGRRRLRLVLLGGICMLAAAGTASSTAGFDRFAYPLQTVITHRIAADREALEYFRKAGMPTGSRFLALAREARLTTRGDALPHPGSGDPRLLAFHRWLLRHGRSTYMRYLVSHPGAIAEPLGDLRSIVLDPSVQAYSSPGSPAPLRPLADVLYPRGPAAPVAYLAIALLVAIVASARHGARRDWVVPLGLIALSLPHGMLVWLADAAEVDRHAFESGLMLRLGSLLLLLMALDVILDARRTRGQALTPSSLARACSTTLAARWAGTSS